MRAATAPVARPPTPHDKLFRIVFAECAYAAALLQRVLPGELSACIDQGSLRLEESQLRAELDDTRADLVFSAAWLAAAERLGGDRVYFVLEHKSQGRADVVLQILGYVHRWLKKWLNARQQSGAANADDVAFPVVIPVLVQHGKPHALASALLRSLAVRGDPREPWTAASLQAIFVDDLALQSVDELLAAAMPAVPRFARFCLARAALEGTFERELAGCARLLGEVQAEAGTMTWNTIELYLYEVGHIEAQRLIQIAASATPAVEESMKTTKEQLLDIGRAEGEAAGRAKGKAEGRAEGEAAGRAKGKAELLEDLLTARFGPIDATTRAKLAAATDEELREWVRSVLVAKSLEDVFGKR